MIDPQAAQELVDAVTRRLAERRALAEERRAERLRDRAQFAARRDAGLRRRHQAKLTRETNQENARPRKRAGATPDQGNAQLTSPAERQTSRTPRRLQRGGPGWTRPLHAADVDGMTRWANPFPVDEYGHHEATRLYEEALLDGRLFSRRGELITAAKVRRALAGRDVVCTCSLDVPCHGDTLLALAAEEPPRPMELGGRPGPMESR
jgi:hypothetical protein